MLASADGRVSLVAKEGLISRLLMGPGAAEPAAGAGAAA